MDPKTAIRYLLLFCFVVDVGICLSSTEERNLRFANPTFIDDITTKVFGDSEGKSPKRYRRVPNESYDEDDEDDVDGAPPDHVIPHSAHEDPEEPPTKPKYRNPGDWAKPPPGRDIPLDFVPTKLYAQVRGTHTVKRVPQEEAVQSAETAEEILAAPRLREVVSNSKKNTIYTEEGYEDSAYDHAGHIRDADYREAYAKKLNDKQTSKESQKGKPTGHEREDIRSEDSGSDEELNEYDDDSSDRAEEATPNNRGRKKSRGGKYKIPNSLRQNPELNPQRIADNEIERLEGDLEKEYAESEKSAENEVPENLKHNESDDEDESNESDRELESRVNQGYGQRTHEKIPASRGTSGESSGDQSGERFESQNRGPPVAPYTEPADAGGSTSTSANPAGLSVYETAQKLQIPPGQSLPPTTPNYGNLYWNYFKLVEDKWKPRMAATPGNVVTTVTEAGKMVPEEMPTFTSVHTTLRDFDSFSFNPPRTELSDFVLTSSSMGPVFPRPSTIYESWKRQDREASSHEGAEFGNVEAASNSYPMEFAATTKIEEVSSTNMQPDETTTLMSPKKLSYTVIIRSNDKTTTMSPPCNHDGHARTEETHSIVQLTSPKYKKMLEYLKDQASSREINHVAEQQQQQQQQQDYAVIQSPLSVPLRQVTYTDFLPDSYAGRMLQTVTQESGQLGKQVNGGRDRHNGVKSPQDKRFSNLDSHASEAPHFHHHHRRRRGHHSPSGQQRRHRHSPPTELQPPAPIARSNYADYLAMKRLPIPRSRFDRSPRLNPWPKLVRLYRSIDRRIFERRRRRSLGRERRIENANDVDGRQSRRKLASNARGKVNYRGFDKVPGGNLRSERNLFNEGANRLVALVAAVKLSGDENIQPEKSGAIRRIRNHEELLSKAPVIAEEEINAEIEKQFKNEEDEEVKYEDEEKKDDDSEENERGQIDVEVPEFDVAEVIDDSKNEKIIDDRPTKSNKLDTEKYPFYENPRVPQSSALKYITNPRQVPRKTLGGTEFYDSRDRYRECDEVEPNLDEVLPEEEEPVPGREPRVDGPRLRGLGDKLDCFRAKYFDEDPLDNPLFLEKLIDQPRAPVELEKIKIASNLFEIPSQGQQEREIVLRVSRKPENDDLRNTGSTRNQVTEEDERITRTIDNANSRREEKQLSKDRRNRRYRPERREQKKKSERASIERLQNYPITPYQRQVYEDVMGTIKNLAGVYQAYGEPVSNPPVQPNVNHVPVDPVEEKDRNYPVVLITEKPRSFLIHGLLPPHTTADSQHQPLQRYRVFPYRTNKVTYRTRERTESPLGADGVKVGYFKTVRVHKRSVDNSEMPGDPDMETEESRSIAVRNRRNSNSTASPNTQPSQDAEKGGKPVEKERVVYTIRDRIRHSKPRGDIGKYGKFSHLEAAGTEDVRRREPRYNQFSFKNSPSTTTSIPSNTTNGEKTQEIASTSAVPKTVIAQDRTVGRPDFHNEPGEIYKIQFSTTRGKQTSPIASRRSDDEGSVNEDDEEEKGSKSSRRKNPSKKNYDVHENVEDDVTDVDPTKAPAFYNLQEYLNSEPPGYSEAFPESVTEHTWKYKGRRRNKKKKKEEQKEEEEEKEEQKEEEKEEEKEDEKEEEKEEKEEKEEEASDEDEDRPPKSYERSETRRSDKDEEEEEEPTKEDEKTEEDEQLKRPAESESDEDTSSNSEEAKDAPDSSEKSESTKKGEDDKEETKEGEDSDDSEKEFERFSSRPLSPFESYEDPKYADLGPRLNKPAFIHPKFEKPKPSKFLRRKYLGGSDDEGNQEESTKKRSRYIFPWEEDASEGTQESKDAAEHILGRYEYPWERRERLAKERVKKETAQREYAKLFGYPEDSVSEEGEWEKAIEPKASNSELHGVRVVYPWHHYAGSSKNRRQRNSRRSSQYTDNAEDSTEFRPVTKFSSRYKSPTINLNDISDIVPVILAATDPSEIRISVIEPVKKTTEAPPVDPIEVLKNIVQTSSGSVATSTTANPYRLPGGTTSTAAPRRLRNWKSTSTTPATSTIAPLTTTTRPTRTPAKPRTWRKTSTTGKKPTRSRKRAKSVVGNDILKSGSQKTEVTTSIPTDGNYSTSTTSTPLETTTPSVVSKKSRRRGQVVYRLPNSATTARSTRRRLPKSTVAPQVEETTLEPVTERTTTPKTKTIEHRSSFSKEEIITKTSYPQLDASEENEEENIRGNKKSYKNEWRGKDSKKSNNLVNESVKKVSIVTKKTPDHIYRTEEVDKDGVKGMFVSITPNNGTSTSLESLEAPEDRSIGNERSKKILEKFDNFDDKENEEDAGLSFMQDSHMMANLLRQVPPFMNDLTFDQSFQGEGGGGNLLETEGSGVGYSPGRNRPKTGPIYEKDPSNRLYYYVED